MARACLNIAAKMEKGNSSFFRILQEMKNAVAALAGQDRISGSGALPERVQTKIKQTSLSQGEDQDQDGRKVAHA